MSAETLTMIFTGVGLLFAVAGGFAWFVSRMDAAILASSLKTEGEIQELRRESHAQTETLRQETQERFTLLDKKIDNQTDTLRKEFQEQTAPLRKEMQDRTDSLDKKFDGQTATLRKELNDQIAPLQKELTEVKISAARIEGALRPRLILPD